METNAERRRRKLTALCEERGLKNVAARSEVSAASLDQIIKGVLLPPKKDGSRSPRNLGDDAARKIEDAESLGRGWFDLPDEATASILKVSGPAADRVEAMASMGAVPLISWVQAGSWSDVADPFQPGDADDWLPCPVAHGPRCYAVRVRGDSMNNPGARPSYSDGDIIFVDPDRRANHGDRVIVRLDDHAEATFKQLLVEDGRKLLKALNPEWAPRYVSINGHATIVGVVIGKWVPE
jgi:SOS-response transcriptional repressor LexA